MDILRFLPLNINGAGKCADIADLRHYPTATDELFIGNLRWMHVCALLLGMANVPAIIYRAIHVFDEASNIYFVDAIFREVIKKEPRARPTDRNFNLLIRKLNGFVRDSRN